MRCISVRLRAHSDAAVTTPGCRFQEVAMSCGQRQRRRLGRRRSTRNLEAGLNSRRRIAPGWAPILVCLLLIGGCAQNAISLAPPSPADTPTASSAPASPGASGQALSVEAKPPGNAAVGPIPPPQVKATSLTAVAPKARDPDQGQRMIVSFRNPTVIIYDSEHSNVGQRLPVASFSLPMIVGSSDVSSNRLPITMVEGTRWLAKDEVMLK